MLKFEQSQEIDNNIKIFFEKYFSSEAKKHLTNKEWILHYIIKNKAWVDATISERFNSGSNIIKNKEYIIANLENELLNNSEEICESYDLWHSTVCNRTVFDMRYGIWQKLINMTFKYLYCVNEIFPEFSCVWKKCHCPVDTVISKQVYNRLLSMNLGSDELMLSKKISESDSVINWNHITESDYLALQEQIKMICENEKISQLEFDFLYWNK